MPTSLQLAEIARKAGDAIMQFYRQQDYNIELKADKSPVTSADMASHDILVKELRLLDANSPIISEETHKDTDITDSAYWLLDPLDGTREFINHSDEFTVNIAYIQDQHPILGIVYAPALDKLYYGNNSSDSAKKEAFLSHGGGAWQVIRTRNKPDAGLSVYASLRHDDEAKLRQTLSQHYNFHIRTFLKIGSSLKFCLIAEGKADAYLRLTPTHGWDTAAAHAVLGAAGGEVLDTNNAPLCYGKAILNPPFMAVSQALRNELTTKLKED